jgi:murein DD-endopeptidase MepM/ murein hydrolase activator NlpD
VDVLKRCLTVGFCAAAAVVWGVPAVAQPVNSPLVPINAVQGTIIRWSVPGTKRCNMGGRSWAAVEETCYYPIDMLHPPGLIRVSRHGAGRAAFANILVVASSQETENIPLGEIPQAHPSPTELRRNARDQAVLAKMWAAREGPARFTLPLGPPATPLGEGKGFGVKWVFNGNPDTWEIHSGLDYALPPGTPALALADGKVVLAADLFFAGNAVFIDHGNGLFVMYFHLSAIKVQAGQDVRKGEVLGLVGGTGRVTGPHLHLGIRWHQARIDPQILLNDPAKIPAF